MSKPFYQLTTKNGMPTFYIFMDNMDKEDRLLIKVMIYHCGKTEYDKVFKEIQRFHGDDSIEKNEGIEFMKYAIIHYKNEVKVIDLDTQRFVTVKGNSLHNSLVKLDVIQGESLHSITQQNVLSNGPSYHHGDKSTQSSSLDYKTRKHGKIKLTFNKYSDPNTRNGFSCNIQKNINKDSMYGALIYATNPKFLRVKKATTIPKIPSKDEYMKIKHGKNYWKVCHDLKKKYMGRKNADSIMLPVGRFKTESQDKY
jgi:hypothetical protein